MFADLRVSRAPDSLGCYIVCSFAIGEHLFHLLLLGDASYLTTPNAAEARNAADGLLMARVCRSRPFKPDVV